MTEAPTYYREPTMGVGGEAKPLLSLDGELSTSRSVRVYNFGGVAP